MQNTDILLVGSGIMSTTLGMLLKTLNPDFKITLLEQHEDIATESTEGWNNAGTGHAGYCELNYTPAGDNKSITTDKAQEINESFEISLQFWSYLVQNNIVSNHFIRTTPHMSFVWGADDVGFLNNRYQALKPLPQFAEMHYSDDFNTLNNWMPLLTKGRDKSQNIAATRIDHGVDVDFGAISRGMLDHLAEQKEFEVHTHHRVIDLNQLPDKTWHVTVKNSKTKKQYNIQAKFVFIGAGGASLHLLQKSKIPEARLYGGFPVSGQFLVCHNPSIVAQHHAKVYGKAPLNAPPMSVPHLDTRVVDGHKALLFGPFAGFTTRFLKRSSPLDWFASIKPYNLIPVLQVGFKNMSLLWYLIKEVTHTHKTRMASLRDYYPEAKNEDWQLIHAGKRVQIIKKTNIGGVLQFGTEVVSSQDGTLTALLGASPGASVVAETAIQILEKSFPEELTRNKEKMQEIIPSYQQKLTNNATLLEEVRRYVRKTLNI